MTRQAVETTITDGQIQGVAGAGSVHIANLAIYNRGYEEPGSGRADASPVPPCPYPGLLYFGPDEAGQFFGRDIAIERLSNLLHQQSLVALVGASGSGKSSTVLAGLAPYLHRTGDWRFGYFRIGTDDPFQALARALVPLFIPSADEVDRLMHTKKLALRLQTNELTLRDVLSESRSRLKDRRILLIADQFEEALTLIVDETLRRRFVDALLDAFVDPAQRSRPDVCLLLTLRADFYGLALEYRPLADALQGRVENLGPMNREELKTAIVRPAENAKVSFEPGLVDTLLDDVGSNPGSLPLLQFALREMWGRQAKAMITRDSYDTIGRVQGALARRAEAIFAALTENGTNAQMERDFQRLFTRLVTVGDGQQDTRRVVERRELGDEVWSLAQRLAGETNRLVVTSAPAPSHETVELVHETLIRQWPKLAEWISRDRAFLSWLRQIRPNIELWLGDPTDEGPLLRGSMLAQAKDWLAQQRDELTPTERDYIEASAERDEQERAQKRADTIWEPLEFHDSTISTREIESLWELAVANERVRRAFLRRLYELPHRARRFCRLPEPVVRAAIGLRRNGAELLRDNLHWGFAMGANPDVVAATLLLLACTGEDDTRAYEVLEGGSISLTYDLTVAVASWALSLAPQLDGPRAGRALDCVLDAIDQTSDPSLLRLVARASQALADAGARVDAGHAARALEHILDAVGQTANKSRDFSWRSDRRDADKKRRDAALALGWMVKALAPCLGTDHAALALERILGSSSASNVLVQAIEALTPRVDTRRAERALAHTLDRTLSAIINRDDEEDDDKIYPLREAVLAFAKAGAQVHPDDARRALERVYGAVDQAIRPSVLSNLAEGAKVLAQVGVRVDPERARHTVERILDVIGETTDPNKISALVTVWQTLAEVGAHVNADHGSRALDHILEVIGETTDPDKIPARALAQACQTLAKAGGRVNADHGGRALDHILEVIGETTDPDKILRLASASQALAQGLGSHLDTDRAERAFNHVLDTIRKTYGYNRQSLVWAAQGLASHFDINLAESAFNHVLNLSQTIGFPDALEEVAQTLAKSLAPRHGSECSVRTLNRVLDAIDQQRSFSLKALSQLVQTFAEAGSPPDVDRVSHALDRVLDTFGRSTPSSLLEQDIQALQAFTRAGARIDTGRAGRALERALDTIAQSTDPDQNLALGRAARALTEAGAQVQPDDAQRALERVLDAIDRATQPDLLTAIGQILLAVAPHIQDERMINSVISALKLPTSVLHERDKLLLEALRQYFPNMPVSEAGFWVAIKWLRQTCIALDFDAPPIRRGDRP